MEEKQTLKLKFLDFRRDWIMQDFFRKFLSKYYDLQFVDNPDYILYANRGFEHLQSKYSHCVKIFYTEENMVPDFNLCDYAMAYHYLTLEDRYLRFPLFLIYAWDKLEQMQQPKQIDESLAHRKFCNFVYTNGGWTDPYRDKFYHQLSKYKKIDSGGGHLNNVGGRIPDKMKFIKDYKFTIAMENSVVSGYTTEKIIQPMMVNSLPIYYGNPKIDLDFNPASFINVSDFHSMQEAIDYIIYLDENDTAYLEKLSQGWFIQHQIKEVYEQKLLAFFRHITEQPLEEARRTTPYGWIHRYKRERRRMLPLADKYLVRKMFGLYEKIKGTYE